MKKPMIGILHYSAPPVIGGVEAVMKAQARLFLQAGYPVMMIAGNGNRQALPESTELIVIPEMDTRHPAIQEISAAQIKGSTPENFDKMMEALVESLRPSVGKCQHVIVHNVFTKHFNLPLTAALDRLVRNGASQHTLAWCHDASWASPGSYSKVHPGYPWDLLRTAIPGVSYVTVSKRRQRELARLFGCESDEIEVVYNGLDPRELLGLTEEGWRLITHLGLMESDLILLMPVRVTQAKNIEYALQVLGMLKRYAQNPKLVITGPPDPHDPMSMQYYQSLKAIRDGMGLCAQAHFVYDCGPRTGEPYQISAGLVGELLRISDMVLMSSHREGFGMPVVEAGIAGVPVAASSAVPAAQEIADRGMLVFHPDMPAEALARQITRLVRRNPICRYRRRIRMDYSWQAIFQAYMEPLVLGKEQN